MVNKFYCFTFLAISLCTLVLPWDDDKKPVLPADTLPQEIDLTHIPKGFEALPIAPSDNPLTEEKVRLGRKLFFDPILSSNGTVACASCHDPKHGFASPEAFSVGFDGQRTKRNAPSILNRAYGKHFFWDGRSQTLESQALGPLSSRAELGGDLNKVIEALTADREYVAEFKNAFAADVEASVESYVTVENITKAIASFERTLLIGDSNVDRFRRSDYSALSREARQGMWIFESRGGCWKCHSGPNFTDEDFHRTGVGFGLPDRDTGRMQFSGDENDRHKLKTPSLRNVELTPPYMHNGSLKTLREVAEFYNQGGSPDDPQLDERIKPLELSDDEVGFLVEFLKALTSKVK